MNKESLQNQIADFREKEKYIFVSYSSLDWEKVYPIVIDLQKKGINVWIDNELRSEIGNLWYEKVYRTLRSPRCKGVMYFMSENSIGSVPVHNELIFSKGNEFKNPPTPFMPVDIRDNNNMLLSDWISYLEDECDEMMDELTANESESLKDCYTRTKYDGAPFVNIDSLSELLEYKISVVRQIYKLCFNSCNDVTYASPRNADIIKMLKKIFPELDDGLSEEPVSVNLSGQNLEKAEKPRFAGGKTGSPQLYSIPRDLTEAPKIVNEMLILHRQKELEELEEKFLSVKTCLLLISGFVGIGKSTVARKLFYKLNNNYKHLAWINYNGSIRESFLNDVNLFREEEDNNVRWENIKSTLKKCRDDLLVFIDNLPHGIDSDVNNKEDFEWLTELPHLVATSRSTDIFKFERYEIPFLNVSQGIDIFYKYFVGDEERTQVQVVEQLVTLVSCHTLSIELLAGGAKARKYRFNLEKYLEDLIEHGFGFSNEKVLVDHENSNLTMAENLSTLFNIQEINDDEKLILSNFCIMPKGLVLPLDVSERIGFEDDVLDHLVDDLRWISFTEHGYLVFDIVFESLRMQNFGDQYEKAERIIKTILYDDYFNDKDVYAISAVKLKIANAYSDYFTQKDDEEWAKFNDLLGYRNRMSGEYVKALEYYEKALKIRKALLGEDHIDTAFTYNGMAEVYFLLGEYAKALEYYNAALKTYEQKLGKESIETASAYNDIAFVNFELGEYDEALVFYEKALAIRVSGPEKDLPDTAKVYNNMALVYYERAEHKKAMEYFEMALDIRERRLGLNHPFTATTFNCMGGVYFALGKYDKAMEYHEKALEIRERVRLGHPATSNTYSDMAMVYYAKAEYDKAMEYHEKALEIREKKLGKNHQYTAFTYYGIACVFSARGEYETAMEYFEKALTIYEQIGKEHPATAYVYNGMAEMYFAKAEYEKAMEYFEKALEIRERKLGINHQYTASTYNGMAKVFSAEGDLEKAIEFFTKALIVYEKIANDHPDILSIYNCIAEVYSAMGESQKSQEYQEKALSVVGN